MSNLRNISSFIISVFVFIMIILWLLISIGYAVFSIHLIKSIVFYEMSTRIGCFYTETKRVTVFFSNGKNLELVKNTRGFCRNFLKFPMKMFSFSMKNQKLKKSFQNQFQWKDQFSKIKGRLFFYKKDVYQN